MGSTPIRTSIRTLSSNSYYSGGIGVGSTLQFHPKVVEWSLNLHIHSRSEPVSENLEPRIFSLCLYFIFTIPERRRYPSTRMSQQKSLKMRKMRKSHLIKRANLVWEPLLSPILTKSKKSLATEKGSGGPFGGALNNPLQDYHDVKFDLKGL